ERGVAFFDEQWEGEYLIGPIGCRCVLLDRAEDRGMGERFQVGERLRVGEDELAKCATVEATIVADVFRTEALGDAGEQRRAGRRDLARDDIRVDDGDAEGGKQF